MSKYIEREAVKSKKVYCVERHEFVVPVAEIDWTPAADVEPVQRWISVEDRLPAGSNGKCHCESVVAYTVEGEVCPGWMNRDTWYLLLPRDNAHSKHGRGYVTHWMPMPEPPKEG